MMRRKTCPILKAGTMINAVHTETSRTTVHNVYSTYPICIGEECEWYYHGCPAHPIDPEIIKGIKGAKK